MAVDRFAWLVPALGLALVVVAVFRLAEVAADVLLRTAGQPATAAPPLVGAVAAATVAVIVLLLLRRFMTNLPGASFSRLEDMDLSALSDDEKRRLEAFAERGQINDENLPLSRVIAIGQTIDADGVRLELIAIELRTRSGRLTTVLHDAVGRAEELRILGSLRGSEMPEPDAFPLALEPIIQLADDVGTEYRILPAGGGGNAGTYRSEFTFSPAIPESARSLTVVIERLTNEPEVEFARKRRPARTIEGPWRIEVPLHAV